MSLKRHLGDEAEGITSLKAPREIFGHPVNVVVNCIKADTSKICNNLNRYEIGFQPLVDSIVLRTRILNEVPMLSDRAFIFAGRNLIYIKNLKDDNLEVHINHGGIQYLVTLKFINAVIDFSTITNIANLVFKESLKCLKLKSMKANYYDVDQKIEVKEARVEIWPGLATAVRLSMNSQHEELKAFLSVDIVHKFMRQDTILDISHSLMKMTSRDWQEKLKKEVIGFSVLTDYTNKIYNIVDINFNMSPKSTFKVQSGEEMSYYDYFLKTYNITIKDKDQFMLEAKLKSKIVYLVPELTRATGLSEKMRSNYNQMRAISDAMKVDPPKRVDELQKFLLKLRNNQEAMKPLQSWGINLEEKLHRLSARELDSQGILFDSSVSGCNSKGEWELGKSAQKLKIQVDVSKWAIIYPKRLEEAAGSLIEKLKKEFRSIACPPKDPKHFPIYGDSKELYVEKIEEIAKLNPKFILFLLPTRDSDRYQAVKKNCLVKNGIPCQVVVSSTLEKKNSSSVINKISIQIATKIGALPWTLEKIVSDLYVVGYDTSTHLKKRNLTVGTFVGAMDVKNSGIFYSSAKCYRKYEDVHEDFLRNMKKSLDSYRDIHGKYPKYVLIYRDNVGDGMMDVIAEKEKNPLRELLENLDCKMSYFVVNRKVNTRFMKMVNDSFTNPKPGTVISDDIGHDHQHGFFLISQYTQRGTVSPTHYICLYSNFGESGGFEKFGPEKLQMLTYKLCHLYYNWSGTTRTPGVCQFAKKLAALASQLLNENETFHDSLNTLYFL